MNYPADPYKTNTKGQTRQERKKSGGGGATAFFVVLLWAGLVFGGFYITKQYIDKAVQKVQQTNALNVEAVNERLDDLNSEMKNLKKALGDADETLSSAGDLQRELTKKIEALEEQMEGLEKSLNILKEAPNGAR